MSSNPVLHRRQRQNDFVVPMYPDEEDAEEEKKYAGGRTGGSQAAFESTAASSVGILHLLRVRFARSPLLQITTAIMVVFVLGVMLMSGRMEVDEGGGGDDKNDLMAPLPPPVAMSEFEPTPTQRPPDKRPVKPSSTPKEPVVKVAPDPPQEPPPPPPPESDVSVVIPYASSALHLRCAQF